MISTISFLVVFGRWKKIYNTHIIYEYFEIPERAFVGLFDGKPHGRKKN